MFYVNGYKEERGGYLCVYSRPFYRVEEAEASAFSLSKVSGDIDYLVEEVNMKGKWVESL
jgi:hypothetical protein